MVAGRATLQPDSQSPWYSNQPAALPQHTATWLDKPLLPVNRATLPVRDGKCSEHARPRTLLGMTSAPQAGYRAREPSKLAVYPGNKAFHQRRGAQPGQDRWTTRATLSPFCAV